MLYSKMKLIHVVTFCFYQMKNMDFFFQLLKAKSKCCNIFSAFDMWKYIKQLNNQWTFSCTNNSHIVWVLLRLPNAIYHRLGSNRSIKFIVTFYKFYTIKKFMNSIPLVTPCLFIRSILEKKIYHAVASQTTYAIKITKQKKKWSKISNFIESCTRKIYAHILALKRSLRFIDLEMQKRTIFISSLNVIWFTAWARIYWSSVLQSFVKWLSSTMSNLTKIEKNKQLTTVAVAFHCIWFDLIDIAFCVEWSAWYRFGAYGILIWSWHIDNLSRCHILIGFEFHSIEF